MASTARYSCVGFDPSEFETIRRLLARAEESADLAKRWAYAAPPIGLGKSVVWLTREYETATHSLAKTQAVLAAARLANVLNAALK